MHTKVKQWMEREGHSFEDAGKMVGITGQSFHAAITRGTFSRRVTGLLVALTGLSWEDFLLPSERRELKALRRRIAA